MGVPQRFSDLLAARYHLLFSWKMAQIFSTLAGGVVEQLATRTVQIMASSTASRRGNFTPSGNTGFDNRRRRRFADLAILLDYRRLLVKLSSRDRRHLLLSTLWFICRSICLLNSI